MTATNMPYPDREPSLIEQAALETAGPDDRPCATWVEGTDPRWCGHGTGVGCGWGREIHMRHHAHRAIDEAFAGLLDGELPRLFGPTT